MDHATPPTRQLVPIHWQEVGDGPESLLLVVPRVPDPTERRTVERTAGTLGGTTRRVGVVWPTDHDSPPPIADLVQAGLDHLTDCPVWIVRLGTATTVIEPWRAARWSRSRLAG